MIKKIRDGEYQDRDGQRVEARYVDRTAQIRDSRDKSGPVLAFRPQPRT